MSKCCSASNISSIKINQKAICPECQSECKLVPLITLLHQLASPQNRSIKDQPFYFCSKPKCNVVYFGRTGNRYTLDELRSPIGQKQTELSRLICYCFDISEQVLLDDLDDNGASTIKEFVKAQTQAKRCACDIRNPSGRCCLVDFPK